MKLTAIAATRGQNCEGGGHPLVGLPGVTIAPIAATQFSSPRDQ